MNRLYTLPRGFGSFPALEVLDLTYNNITEKGLPGNFFFIGMPFCYSQLALSCLQRHCVRSTWAITISSICRVM